MIALLQRVSQADVTINENQTIAQIGQGLLVLIGIEKTDTIAVADRLLKRILNYRVFSDADDKMNLSLLDIKGDLLLVPQFTLPADTRKGNRPSFTPAAPPEQGKQLFDYLLAQARLQTVTVEAGQFAADMQVSLTNDGPVTFWLQVN
ncbi:MULTISPECIES: D-aminoacyl-tRNA deacylase [unclassified Methylophaga]|jgi:D-tyrosyl-tRNA(Tyr) deacylase|uniref:D-aminoacyl-tRNA deacylase n=1 Tax=unclassified Methylophaga TaxID=2629249 RepID=UPI000C5F66CF|nr:MULTISPECIES: D-aminoacyl-tRNA deacylase [unclassified Methylophaga]MAL48955.1 D-tyrosyl-tRNA(Tyr) deacylase [Methylophaga sp.]MAP27264.1 D-tyrosyl-tRNA(Tyr) deacylase [Methylophaga sp.]MBP25392.1 D-tyrosyl-tRNA(Tyr) deacylase [Methylophaga sp.]HAD32382.1 D-tyrosyl-tRNA(Tyr) deacylase [Methylophaga sp.]HCC82864.1 D-tyrosyl-tRNA(Tyr) deacylase [Methylophaga sp.]|tara:strand:- start:1772 stop:2215 length:444 start_codon:yes stop_codon:yes gene_type:complete